MHNIAQSELIEKIWEGLSAPKVRTYCQTSAELIKRALAQRWLDLEDVRDLLWAIDGRLNVQISKLATTLGIPTRYYYRRPQGPDAIGQLGMTVEDLAAFLIQTERLGFDIDPMLLVKPLREQIKKSKHLTDSELAIFWYPKNRHKQAGLTLVEKPESIGRPAKDATTSANYRIQIWRNETGRATMLYSFPPEHKVNHSH